MDTPLTRRFWPTGEGGGDEAGVPGFWLQALQNNVMLAEEVQKHDEVCHTGIEP